MGFFSSIMRVLMILLVSVLTVCIILGAILMIFPGARIFGLHYISAPYNSVGGEYVREPENPSMWDNADVVRIETKGYNIIVRTKGDEVLKSGQFATITQNSYHGFVWGSVDRPTYSSSITDEKYLEENGKKIFYIRIEEPDGWMIGSKTDLTIIVDTDTFANKDLEILTESGLITLGGDVAKSEEKINTKNLKITSASGEVRLNNVSVNDNLTIEKVSGNIVSAVNLDSHTTIKIKGGYGNVTLKEIGSSDSEKMLRMETSNTHTTLDKIYGDLEFEADGGLLEVTSIKGYVDLDIASCAVKIETVQGDLNIENKEGSVEIERVMGSVGIDANNGSTVINETDGAVDWESQRGSLTLNKAKGAITATSVYGNISINCDTSVEGFDMLIHNKHGQINFSDAKGIVQINVSASIDTQGTHSIKGSFAEVKGESEIISHIGDITLTVPQTPWPWLLKWRSPFGSAKINIPGSVESTNNNSEGWKSVLGASESGSDKVSITSHSGKITVKTA